jgi:hypothetical protein
MIFRRWKDVPRQNCAHEEAYFAWSGWLLRAGQPKKALTVMNGLLQQLHGDPKAAAEARWKNILDGDDDIEDEGDTLSKNETDSEEAVDAEVDESMSDVASLGGYESNEDISIEI